MPSASPPSAGTSASAATAAATGATKTARGTQDIADAFLGKFLRQCTTSAANKEKSKRKRDKLEERAVHEKRRGREEEDERHERRRRREDGDHGREKGSNKNGKRGDDFESKRSHRSERRRRRVREDESGWSREREVKKHKRHRDRDRDRHHDEGARAADQSAVELHAVRAGRPKSKAKPKVAEPEQAKGARPKSKAKPKEEAADVGMSEPIFASRNLSEDGAAREQARTTQKSHATGGAAAVDAMVESGEEEAADDILGRFLQSVMRPKVSEKIGSGSQLDTTAQSTAARQISQGASPEPMDQADEQAMFPVGEQPSQGEEAVTTIAEAERPADIAAAAAAQGLPAEEPAAAGRESSSDSESSGSSTSKEVATAAKAHVLPATTQVADLTPPAPANQPAVSSQTRAGLSSSDSSDSDSDSSSAPSGRAGTEQAATGAAPPTALTLIPTSAASSTLQTQLTGPSRPESSSSSEDSSSSDEDTPQRASTAARSSAHSSRAVSGTAPTPEVHAAVPPPQHSDAPVKAPDSRTKPPRSRACAKMLVQARLRCKCHYVYMAACPARPAGRNAMMSRSSTRSRTTSTNKLRPTGSEIVVSRPVASRTASGTSSSRVVLSGVARNSSSSRAIDVHGVGTKAVVSGRPSGRPATNGAAIGVSASSGTALRGTAPRGGGASHPAPASKQRAATGSSASQGVPLSRKTGPLAAESTTGTRAKSETSVVTTAALDTATHGHLSRSASSSSKATREAVAVRAASNTSGTSASAAAATNNAAADAAAVGPSLQGLDGTSVSVLGVGGSGVAIATVAASDNAGSEA